MIFSKPLGQATIEAMGTTLTVFIIIVIGAALLLHGLCSLILTKWASRTSHCVAQSRPKDDCIKETTQSLVDHFAFHDVDVRVRTVRGIIHSEVEGRLLSQILIENYKYNPLIKGSYDLEPSEYRRVK